MLPTSPLAFAVSHTPPGLAADLNASYNPFSSQRDLKSVEPHHSLLMSEWLPIIQSKLLRGHSFPSVLYLSSPRSHRVLSHMSLRLLLRGPFL